jgi:hypothetical protein
MRKPIVPFLAVLLSGCAGLDADLPVDDSSEPLVGGTATTLRPEIGQIASPRGWCTATLIAPRYVITAAHCTGGEPPSNVRFMFNDMGGVARTVQVERFQNFTKEISYWFLGDVVFDTDVSLLRLATPVPSSQATPSRVSLNAPRDGEQTTLFGFGCTDRPTGTGGGMKQFFSFLFRSPRSSNLCPGDSGGPGVFGQAGDRGAIWGVNSGFFGDGSDFFGNAAFFKPQIEELMRQWDGELEVGMDRPGMDYTYLWLPTAAACQAQCRGDGRCHAFAWAPWGNTGYCTLKDGVPDLVPAAGWTSGVAPVMEIGVNRNGMDYHMFIPPEPRADLCAAACARDSLCHAWTYVQNGGCWMKNGVPAASSCSSCTSGVLDRVVEPGYDRNGRDLVTLPSPSARSCGDLCARDERCRAYTFSAYDGSCFLKDGVSPATPLAPQYAWAFASGVRRGLDVNTARNGGDYLIYTLNQPNPYECQARCARESQCQAWVYFLPQYLGGPATCGLKDSIPVATSSTGVISGLKGLELSP